MAGSLGTAMWHVADMWLTPGCWVLGAGETVEGSIPGAARVMQQLGLPHELLPGHQQLPKRWPVVAREGQAGL